MQADYHTFLEGKRQLSGHYGFDPVFMPEMAFPFQEKLIEWAVRKGRAALFADCGMGKTLMQLAWAENVVRKTGGRVLILTPLAVSHQTCAEAAKFGIESARSDAGELPGRIVVTNYERLHHFTPGDFEGVVCDESSILKNFDGVIKSQVTEFMRKLKYRLLCTATAAPNDFIELGTSSEALGEMGFMDMLGRFFKKTENTFSRKQETMTGTYRLKPHAQRDFWRWVCSWARAVRSPRDMGFADDGFVLPDLVTREHIVVARRKNPEFLFDMPAVGLAEQRDERRRTVEERCEMAAELAQSHSSAVVCWCHLNSEGDTLEQMIPGSVQVSGQDSDDSKEESFRAFEKGEIRVMITKPTIAGFGLNWQHCSHQTFFPSHSFEQWYQAIRRSWRYGQKNPVVVDVIASEGEQRVLANLQRKAEAADQMFSSLVGYMADELKLQEPNKHTNTQIIPSWL